MNRELRQILEEMIKIYQEMYPKQENLRIRQIVIENYLDRDLIDRKNVLTKR